MPSLLLTALASAILSLSIEETGGSLEHHRHLPIQVQAPEVLQCSQMPLGAVAVAALENQYGIPLYAYEVASGGRLRTLLSYCAPGEHVADDVEQVQQGGQDGRNI